jgi:oligopeptidase A
MAHTIEMVPSKRALPDLIDIIQNPPVEEIEALLQTSIRQVSQLIREWEQASYDTLDWRYRQKLETIMDELAKSFNRLLHAHAIADNIELRKVIKKLTPSFTQWEAELWQNRSLFECIKKQAQHPNFSAWDEGKKKIIENDLKAFEHNGLNLTDAQKKRYQTVQTELAQAGIQFETNLLDSSQARAILIQDKSELAGLSDRVLAEAAKAAQARKEAGWLFLLNEPMYQSVMTHAENRALRKKFYTAWVTRASENTKSDNSPVIYDILNHRSELAQLTQFENYAKLSLAHDKSAESPQAVLDFLTKLLSQTRLQALKEFETLKEFAKKQGHIDELCDWDIAYYSEKLRATTFGIEEEKLRTYFPLPYVLKGLFALLHDLFQIELCEIKDIKTWDPEVQVIEIRDKHRSIQGYVYLDLYTRPNKRSGAWVGECEKRRIREDGRIQLPIAFLNCNFAPPIAEEPALLTHNDVVTLFHEMGHALHHTLTQIDYAAISGMEGVAWDAVEFPSQFLEKFAWEPEILERISKHYQTKEILPKDSIKALNQTHRFQAGLQLMRQLEFSLFDFKLHLNFNPTQDASQTQHLLDKIRKETRVIPVPSFNQFQNSFSHIFAGGYAAGYYSYLWAERLAADSFEYFLEKGLLNPQLGHEFKTNILEKGGSVDMLALFKRFRNQAPDIQALLKQRGINSQPNE